MNLNENADYMSPRIREKLQTDLDMIQWSPNGQTQHASMLRDMLRHAALMDKMTLQPTHSPSTIA